MRLARITRVRSRSGEEGMTLLETSLSVIFMGMFFAALFAASQGIDRLTRGYTCRIVSSDPSATAPERGCPGQADEVSVDGIGMLRLANQSALRALRDDLMKHGGEIDGWAISFADVEKGLDARRSTLDQKCLWEKVEPLRGSRDRFSVRRNYLQIKPGEDIKDPSYSDNDIVPPPPIDRGSSGHVWFIRAGRLMGERMIRGSVEPVEGLQAVEDGLVSINPPSGSLAASQQELSEPTGSSDELEGAPNSNWGLINQVCLYQGPGTLNTLYLLSAERGHDLGNTKPPFFGREVGVASRQPQPRLLFYLP